MTLAARAIELRWDDIRHEAMMRDPARTLARVMDHLAKEPSLPTGDAIRIAGKAQARVRKEKKRS